MEKQRTIGEGVASIAIRHIGKQEIRGNQGFKDEAYQRRIKEKGWKKGESWCVYACEADWKEAHPDEVFDLLDELFSANAVRTWENFWNHPDFITSDTPVVGAMAIYKKVKDGDASFVNDTEWIRGHACTVIGYNKDVFVSVDGNSNDDGSREGYMMTKLTKNYDFKVQNGLQLLGFVYPYKQKS